MGAIIWSNILQQKIPKACLIWLNMRFSLFSRKPSGSWQAEESVVHNGKILALHVTIGYNRVQLRVWAQWTDFSMSNIILDPIHDPMTPCFFSVNMAFQIQIQIGEVAKMSEAALSVGLLVHWVPWTCKNAFHIWNDRLTRNYMT